MVSTGVRADASRAPRRAERESGPVALVEFALILPLFLLIVVGIIQFGVALNFWLDMQRIANQGARWAVVDRYPLPNGTCVEHSPAVQREPADRARDQRIAEGEVIEPYICFPSGTRRRWVMRSRCGWTGTSTSSPSSPPTG